MELALKTVGRNKQKHLVLTEMGEKNNHLSLPSPLAGTRLVGSAGSTVMEYPILNCYSIKVPSFACIDRDKAYMPQPAWLVRVG